MHNAINTTNNIVSKATILMGIEDAKGCHRRWLNNVDLLIIKHTGKKVKEDKRIGRTHKDCEFGGWMDVHGVNLKKVKSLAKCIEEINTVHKRLHTEYQGIYNIYYMNPLKRPISYTAWTKNQNAVHAQEKLELEDIFATLKETSVELLQLLDDLKDLVNKIEYKELEETFKRGDF